MADPPRTPPVRKRLSRQESQARTRSMLLEVAATEFLASGFTATSLERARRRPASPRGPCYANFAGKEELCLAVLENHYFALLQPVRGGVRRRRRHHRAAPGRARAVVGRLPGRRGVAAPGPGVRRPDPPQPQGPGSARRSGNGSCGVAITALLAQQIRQLGVTPGPPPRPARRSCSWAVVGGIAVQRLLDPPIPASLITDAVRALFRTPRSPEGESP